MALLLKEEHVRAVLGMDDALAALEEAFRAVAQGEAVNVSRHRGALKGTTINAMGGISTALDAAAMKVYPIVRQDITVGSSFQVLIYRISTGELLGVLEAETLSQLRTGAASGVAARHMARPESRVMALVGAGWQAQAQVEALRRVLPKLERIDVVISRSAERTERFCREMAARTGLTLTPTSDARRAVEGADVITTSTGARTPVFDGAWLTPGTHVNAIGSNFAQKQEIDVTAVRRADVIVADDVEVAKIECGDLIDAAAQGALNWARVHGLAQVVAGEIRGRADANQITLFESQGLGLEDLAAGLRAIELARSRGVGIEIPLR